MYDDFIISQYQRSGKVKAWNIKEIYFILFYK